jgi:serine-type D-Ala-D-Ala carboxypeptidase (penicillin-binding protein 5/6)
MPLSRRQIYRRRRAAVIGGLALLLGAGVYLPMTLLAPIGDTTAVIAPFTPPVETAPALAFPGYGASAIGAVGFTGTLATAGAADALPIASITKIITALVVLDAHPIGLGETGPEITFTSKDVGFYNAALAKNGSVKTVRSGQVLTQRQIMELTLIASANNYAMSLATWAFGSEAAYVDAARAWLSAQGFTATTIVDATGLSPDDASTATELVAIAKLAIANPVIADITSTKSADEPGVGAIKNTNTLLGKDGVDGIKTGTLDEAGACLLFSADYDIGESTVTVVGVVLGAADHETLASNIQTLLASVVPGFHEVTLVSKGDVFGSYSTAWNDSAELTATESSTVVTWSDTPIAALVEAERITLVDSGDDVGAVTFTVGEQTIVVPLEVDATIDDPGPWWRLTHPAEVL